MTPTEAALEALNQQDSFAAIDQIALQPDVIEAAKTFLAVMRHLYWQTKDLAASIMVGRAGVQFGLGRARALDDSDAPAALQLRGIAKGLTYDIASFTWPGWNEPGITITSTDQAIGLDSAKANLRLARELNRGDLPMSRAYWMLGGHQLSARDYSLAEASYQSAERHAAAAGARGEELLASGFRRLTDLLISRGNPIFQQQLEAIQRELRTVENGPDFAEQIRTARRVFVQR